jgi:hypothetical protein
MGTKTELRVLGSEENSESRGMNRRQMVQRMLLGAGAGMALPAFAATHPMVRHLADPATLAEADTAAASGNWSPLFLDAHQNETLMVLGERIVPGSEQAQANRFIDLLLSVESQENQQRFLNSLSAFDGESLRRYQRPYKSLSEAEQIAILQDASTAEPGRMIAAKEAHQITVAPMAKGEENGHPELGPLTLRDHFENIKGAVSGSYYSSEIGMKELGWTGQVMFASFPGCDHPGGHA